MPRWFLADLKTGRQILDLPIFSGRWERFLNAPETVSCVLNMNDPDTIGLYPRQSAAVGRSVLAVAEGDVILAAGPIWTHSYARDRAQLSLTAKGLWSYYDHRYILPLLAAAVGVDQFTVPDPSAAGKTMPNPALGTYLSGWDLGTIAKKLIQQAHAWTGGSVPVLFDADRALPADADHERNFEGAEFKNLGQVLDQLTQVEHGPDIRFRPRFTADRLGIEWVLETGTDAVPLLSGPSVHSWNLSVPDSPVSDFQVNVDGSRLAGVSWATGGRQADSVVVGRAIDSTLVDDGYPLFELLDSTHSDASEQPTLDRYAGENLEAGRTPVEEWSFTVEAGSQPYVGAYWEGDFIDLDVAPYGAFVDKRNLLPEFREGLYEPVGLPEGPDDLYELDSLRPDPTIPGLYLLTEERAGDLVGDPYLVEGGTFRRRITGMSGDEKGLQVKVTCAPENE